MPVDKQTRPLPTIVMVRLTLRHRAQGSTHVFVIECDELNYWIKHSRTHGFAIEAESIGRSEVGRA